MNAIYFQQDGRLLNHIAVNGDNKYQMINAENGKKQRKVVEEYKEKLKLTLSTPSNSPTKANIDKARRLLNYDPKTTLLESVRAQVDWFKAHFTSD